MEQQRERARAASKFQMGSAVDYQGVKTQFKGYDTLAVDEAQIVAIYRDGSAVQSVHAGEAAAIVLDRTPSTLSPEARPVMPENWSAGMARLRLPTR